MATDSKAVQKAFGDVLRQTRSSRRMSQQALALESGLDRTYISLLERGLRQPTLSTLITLSQTLAVDPGVLVKRTATLLIND